MPGTQKYEREIEEILERLDKDAPRTERVKRQARLTVWQRWQALQRRAGKLRGVGGQSGHAPAWRWIGLTLAAGIVGWLVHPYWPLLGVVCGVVMVVSFFSPLLRELFDPRPDPTSSMWRGKVVDLPPRSGILATLGYRWRRFRRGRG